jgi:hypothetical protein
LSRTAFLHGSDGDQMTRARPDTTIVEAIADHIDLDISFPLNPCQHAHFERRLRVLEEIYGGKTMRAVWRLLCRDYPGWAEV